MIVILGMTIPLSLLAKQMREKTQASRPASCCGSPLSPWKHSDRQLIEKAYEEGVGRVTMSLDEFDLFQTGAGQEAELSRLSQISKKALTVRTLTHTEFHQSHGMSVLWDCI